MLYSKSEGIFPHLCMLCPNLNNLSLNRPLCFMSSGCKPSTPGNLLSLSLLNANSNSLHIMLWPRLSYSLLLALPATYFPLYRYFIYGFYVLPPLIIYRSLIAKNITFKMFYRTPLIKSPSKESNYYRLSCFHSLYFPSPSNLQYHSSYYCYNFLSQSKLLYLFKSSKSFSPVSLTVCF